MTHQSDELELLLQQYADGELHGQPLHAIEQLLAHDAAARQTVAHYRHLSLLLATAQPAIDFDQQLARINFEIDRAGIDTADTDDTDDTAQQHTERSRWRIGTPTTLTRTFAIAAAVAIVASIGLILLRSSTTVIQPQAQQIAIHPTTPPTADLTAAPTISVTGPMAAIAQQVGTVMIRVGPPAGSAAPQGMAEVESIVVPTGRVTAWTITRPPAPPNYLQ